MGGSRYLMGALVCLAVLTAAPGNLSAGAEPRCPYGRGHVDEISITEKFSDLTREEKRKVLRGATILVAVFCSLAGLSLAGLYWFWADE